jgi:hypothetical protein
MEKLVSTFILFFIILLTIALPVKTASARGYGRKHGYGIGHGHHNYHSFGYHGTAHGQHGFNHKHHGIGRHHGNFYPPCYIPASYSHRYNPSAIMQIIRFKAIPIGWDPVIKSLNILMMRTATLTR